MAIIRRRHLKSFNREILTGSTMWDIECMPKCTSELKTVRDLTVLLSLPGIADDLETRVRFNKRDSENRSTILGSNVYTLDGNKFCLYHYEIRDVSIGDMIGARQRTKARNKSYNSFCILTNCLDSRMIHGEYTVIQHLYLIASRVAKSLTSFNNRFLCTLRVLKFSRRQGMTWQLNRNSICYT
ncbi:hypothetical protein WN51_11865 [Melipona quadrifasciata]|uniref:Uncharacterized protein n=1 Tax=Melipona quadrifasciata TaxID=166423 RepID=A0A0M9A3S8_9HYME|nr:hypothetical protein WN51_11865 [Melipona quadrifasciata]